MVKGTMVTYTSGDKLTVGKKYMLKFDVQDEIVCLYVFGLFSIWVNIDETDLLDHYETDTRKEAFKKFRSNNPHIRALDIWAYVKNLEKYGLLEKALCNSPDYNI